MSSEKKHVSWCPQPGEAGKIMGKAYRREVDGNGLYDVSPIMKYIIWLFQNSHMTLDNVKDENMRVSMYSEGTSPISGILSTLDLRVGNLWRPEDPTQFAILVRRDSSKRAQMLDAVIEVSGDDFKSIVNDYTAARIFTLCVNLFTKKTFSLIILRQKLKSKPLWVISWISYCAAIAYKWYTSVTQGATEKLNIYFQNQFPKEGDEIYLGSIKNNPYVQYFDAVLKRDQKKIARFEKQVDFK